MRVGELGWTVTAACPECGRDLRLVERRDGGTFAGCLGYPQCTFTAARDQEFEDLVRDTLEMQRA